MTQLAGRTTRRVSRAHGAGGGMIAALVALANAGTVYSIGMNRMLFLADSRP